MSDEWVDKRLDQASKDGYVTVAFGLRIRTPLLQKTLRNSSSTPHEAQAEGRTAGNAMGQSYGLLNNRAAVAFMEKVWNSPYALRINPSSLIHDASYFIFDNDIEVAHWVNENLIQEMQWQELPEIQHDKVKIGAELDIFYPSWADGITIPNNATQEEILEICNGRDKASDL